MKYFRFSTQQNLAATSIKLQNPEFAIRFEQTDAKENGTFFSALALSRKPAFMNIIDVICAYIVLKARLHQISTRVEISIADSILLGAYGQKS